MVTAMVSATAHLHGGVGVTMVATLETLFRGIISGIPGIYQHLG